LVASTIPVTRQARLLAGVAITGSIPLTLGVILWLIGTVMGAAYHGHWSRTAGLGEAMVLVGLICGLIMFVFAAAGERWTPHEPWTGPGRDGQDLMPLATPEQQAYLAGPQRPNAQKPPTGPAHPPAGMPPGAMLPAPTVAPPPAAAPSLAPGAPAPDEPPDWPPVRDWFDPAGPGEPLHHDDQVPPPYPATPD
jgi:hypothetical protein